jgi:hypothetical protein
VFDVHVAVSITGLTRSADAAEITLIT